MEGGRERRVLGERGKMTKIRDGEVRGGMMMKSEEDLLLLLVLMVVVVVVQRYVKKKKIITCFLFLIFQLQFLVHVKLQIKQKKR